MLVPLVQIDICLSKVWKSFIIFDRIFLFSYICTGSGGGVGGGVGSLGVGGGDGVLGLGGRGGLTKKIYNLFICPIVSLLQLYNWDKSTWYV